MLCPAMILISMKVNGGIKGCLAFNLSVMQKYLSLSCRSLDVANADCGLLLTLRSLKTFILSVCIGN